MSDSQYEMGHAVLNGVDFRCHGFTEYLYGERVEYAWLMQLVIGRIAGAFSTQQVSEGVREATCIGVTTLIRENFIVKNCLAQNDENFKQKFFLLVILYTANIWHAH